LAIVQHQISDWMYENLGNRVSAKTISAITDRILLKIQACKSRMMEFVYPIVWLYAILYTVKDDQGCSVSRAIYNVLEKKECKKELLEMYISHS